MLNAEDPDTPPDGVWYTVTKPSNGRISFLNNTFKDITRFTQQSINAEQVVFVHEGKVSVGEAFYFISYWLRLYLPVYSWISHPTISLVSLQ